MKAIIKILTCFLVMLLLVNCSNNDDDSGNSNQEFSPELLSGTWRISFFSDETTERTSEFSSYLFTFTLTGSDTGNLEITSNGSSREISFDIEKDDFWILDMLIRSSDNPGDADLTDLSENWIVKRVNDDATLLEFEEQNSNKKPEILHLKKVSN